MIKSICYSYDMDMIKTFSRIIAFNDRNEYKSPMLSIVRMHWTLLK